MGRAGWVAVAMAMAFSVSAAAQPAQPRALSWHCQQFFDEFYHAHCVPLGEQEAQPASAPALQGEMPASGNTGSHRELWPVAQRGEAAVFAVPAWRVPLYTLPIDAVFTTELLRAVLCGKVPACEIHYAMPELRGAGVARTTRINTRR